MNKIIGKNLCKLRKANSFSQEQIADYLKIDHTTYSNYESGVIEMPFDLLESVSDLFGCELAVFFEKNNLETDEKMILSFRINDLSVCDLEQIAVFKRIVKNYMKMNRLLQEQ